jgi:hypothetical protein
VAEDIGLQDLVVSLSASLVAARRYLDGASADLRDLYRTEGALGGLPKPRFKLDRVTFEVPYVVSKVDVKTPAQKAVPVGRDISLTERELASLRRGASPSALEQLDTVLGAYAETKKVLRSVASGATDGIRRPTTAPGAHATFSSAELLELRTGASQSAQKKLDALVEDYGAARDTLALTSDARVLGQAPDLRLRVDVQAIQEAVESSRHRVVLSFTAEDVETVEAAGRSIEIVE